MVRGATLELRGWTRRILKIARAGEWWEYKLVPILAVFYATALANQFSLWTLWPAAIALLASLVPGAVYVSVLNDLTDRRDDAIAGKPNRMIGRSWLQATILVGLPVLVGLAFSWWWRHDLPLLIAYLCAWAAFTLYSLPPVRLKVRGCAGVLADASGAHLFPSLVSAFLVYRSAGLPIDWTWSCAVAIWSFACGLRGILWHQLEDADADRAAGVDTFALRHSCDTVVAIAACCVLPVETAALALLLWMIGSPLPVLTLILYVLLVHRRIRCWQMSVTLVRPKPRYIIWLHEYYTVFFPLGLLVASAVVDGRDLAVLVVHLLLFPNRAWKVVEDSWRLQPAVTRRLFRAI